MPDRAKYVGLVVSLNLAGFAVLLGIISAIFDRPFLAVAADLWPALAVCLIAAVMHGMRHDLDT